MTSDLLCPQSNLGDVESMYKRHEDLESTLAAQEEKLRGLNDLADKLIDDDHPDKDQWVERGFKSSVYVYN